jgi:hypothetical protein
MAWKTGCVYEWRHHFHMAQELGVPEAEILSLAEPMYDSWAPPLNVFTSLSKVWYEKPVNASRFSAGATFPACRGGAIFCTYAASGCSAS